MLFLKRCLPFSILPIKLFLASARDRVNTETLQSLEMIIPFSSLYHKIRVAHSSIHIRVQFQSSLDSREPWDSQLESTWYWKTASRSTSFKSSSCVFNFLIVVLHNYNNREIYWALPFCHSPIWKIICFDAAFLLLLLACSSLRHAFRKGKEWLPSFFSSPQRCALNLSKL